MDRITITGRGHPHEEPYCGSKREDLTAKEAQNISLKSPKKISATTTMNLVV